jgi:hypothetical protein
MKSIPISYFGNMTELLPIGFVYISDHGDVTFDVTDRTFLTMLKEYNTASIAISLEKSYAKLDEVIFKFCNDLDEAVCQSCQEHLDLAGSLPTNIFRDHAGKHGAGRMIMQRP